MRYLRGLGVRSIEPSLDLWTHWTRDDAMVLRRAIRDAAEVWFEGLPDHAVNWFDGKAAEISGVSNTGTLCGFGDGELAVAPSGNLYPCERLIGEDQPNHPMRLAGHVLDEQRDFSPRAMAAGGQTEACGTCTMHGMCSTYCRCSNFVRTGDIRRPDGLLCLWNQACLDEVAVRVQSGSTIKELHVCQT